MKFLKQFVYVITLLSFTSQVYSNQVEGLEKRGYTTLKRGKSGTAVKNLQKQLISLGYSCGPSGANGKYNDHTASAVFAFQQANSISADAIAGSQTQTKLYGKSAKRNIVNGDETSSTVVASLKKGSKGSSVKRAQLRLILLGYNCGKSGADGDFGSNTVSCVKAFQKNNSLSQTGAIDSKTHKKLFSRSAINVIKKNNSLSRFVNTALQEYNYKALSGKKTKYGAFFNIQGNWCAMFVSWVASENNSVSTHIINKTSAVANFLTYFKNKKRFGERGKYSPQYGDIMILKSNGASHVAIVLGYKSGYVYTIEGNYSSKVSIVKRSKNDKTITGYGKNGSGSAGYAVSL